MSADVRWALSVIDRRYHAVPEHGGHPSGAFRAECGDTLPATVNLRDEVEASQICEGCAEVQFVRATSEE